jgi:tetratricopeptide (TPR) repeat protein/DNA-binding SARP family transcriptional activator
MWKTEWHTTSGQQPQDTLGWPTSLVHLLPPNFPQDVPLARIITCGCSPVSVEVLQGFQTPPENAGTPLCPIYTPLTAQQWNANGGRTALVLLEILISQPGLVVSHDLLAQALRPARRSAGAPDEEGDEDDGSEDRALKRPENVVTLLRRLLYPPALAHLPQADQRAIRNALIVRVKASTDSGPAYRLASQPLLWIDVEVMEAYYQRIPILTQFGENVQDAWRAICELGLHGQFMPHERYSDWAQWRRARVREMLWQSVDTQVKAMSQWEDQESGEEASLRLLSAYWQAEPANEDAFRVLAEKLGRRERFQHAEECYAQLCLALEQEGREPHERTEKVMKFVRAKHIQRAPAPIPKSAESTRQLSLPFSSLQEDKQGAYRPAFTEPAVILWQSDRPSQTIPSPVPIEFLALHAEIFAGKQSVGYDTLEHDILELLVQKRFPLDALPDLQQLIDRIIRKYDAMQKDLSDYETRVTRRNVLQAIVTFPIHRYGLAYLAAEMHSPVLHEVLPACATGIIACRDLLRDEPDGLIVVRHRLPTYLFLLGQVVRQSSLHQSTAARLASQSCLLLSILAEHDGKLDQMEAALRQARLYGQYAQDVNLEVSALIRLAIKFDYEHRDRKALETYQEALAHPAFSTISSLLQGRVYAGLAGTHAYCAQNAQALSFLSQAKEVYPDKPEADEIYPFAFCDRNTLALWEGLTLKHTNNHSEAFNAFTHFGKLAPLPGLLELHRAEHLNYAASVAVKQRNLDVAVTYLDTAEEIAWQLQDAMRLAEIRETLRGMSLLWPEEAPVKRLQEKCSTRP